MLTILFVGICFLSAVFVPYFFYMFWLSLHSVLNRSGYDVSPVQNSPQKRFAFVIPGHNEEAGILETIKSCYAVDYPENLRHVFVIADNCNDATASVSRAGGASVFERFHETNKSKGYALEAFFEHFFQQPENEVYEGIVVVDADSRIDKNMLNVFSQRLNAGQNWIQSYYTVSNPDASWRTRLLTYALSLFNGIWLKGQTSAGLSCSLRGNGMCFQREALIRFPWKAYSLAEDLEFSWHLRLAGERVWFAHETQVFGEMVSKGGAAASNQRQRWEVGRLVLKQMFLKQIFESKKLKFSHRWFYWVDFRMPTLVKIGLIAVCFLGLDMLLIAIENFGFSGEFATANIGAAMMPFHLVFFGVLALYALLPFVVMKLPLSYLAEFPKIPFYALWKITLLFKPKPKGWVRTERE